MLEILSKLWVPLLFFITIINIGASVIIKINDIKHLHCDIKKIWNKVEEISKEQVQQGKDIVALKTWRDAQE